MSPQQRTAISFSKRLLLFLVVGTASIFLIKAIYALGPQSPESPGQERKLATREFKDMPVELVEVRNLQSDTWWKDLEIELKNVSKKPIYYLSAYLEFPDDGSGGSIYGILLSWGNGKKLDTRKFADSDAEHVEPGDTFVLTIPEMYIKGLRAMHRMRPQVTYNLRLWFEKTYFGDGTGFESEGHWQDFRGNDPPPKLEKRHHSKRLKEARNHATTSIPEPICGGGNCFRWVVPQNPGPSSCSGCLTRNATVSAAAPSCLVTSLHNLPSLRRMGFWPSLNPISPQTVVIGTA
jgi:hypothetical protein